MKKSEKLARKTLIWIIVAACVEVGMIGRGLWWAYLDGYDRGCFWLLCCVVWDMNYTRWRAGMEDKIDGLKMGEELSDRRDFFDPCDPVGPESFSERLERFNRKINKL